VEWPPIKLGVWKPETTRVLPTGKKRHRAESARACTEGESMTPGEVIVTNKLSFPAPMARSRRVATGPFRTTYWMVLVGSEISGGHCHPPLL
jgi:hypothetical protein